MKYYRKATYITVIVALHFLMYVSFLYYPTAVYDEGFLLYSIDRLNEYGEHPYEDFTPYGKTPLLIYMYAPVDWLFGNTWTTLYIIRTVQVLLLVASSVALFLLLLKHTAKYKVSLIITLLYIMTPILSYTSITSVPSPIVALLLIISLHLYLNDRYIATGVCLGLIFWFRPIPLVIGMAFALDLFRRKNWFKNIIKIALPAFGIIIYGLLLMGANGLLVNFYDGMINYNFMEQGLFSIKSAMIHYLETITIIVSNHLYIPLATIIMGLWLYYDKESKYDRLYMISGLYIIFYSIVNIVNNRIVHYQHIPEILFALMILFYLPVVYRYDYKFAHDKRYIAGFVLLLLFTAYAMFLVQQQETRTRIRPEIIKYIDDGGVVWSTWMTYPYMSGDSNAWVPTPFVNDKCHHSKLEGDEMSKCRMGIEPVLLNNVVDAFCSNQILYYNISMFDYHVKYYYPLFETTEVFYYNE